MAKKVTGSVKLQIAAGKATPAPPVGPALGQAQINIMEFCKQFNARTQDKMGKVVPVLITVYADKSFDFIIKTAPAAIQLMEAAKIQKGSKESNRAKVGKVTWEQVEAALFRLARTPGLEEASDTAVREAVYTKLFGE